jgi:hypothetical protein
VGKKDGKSHLTTTGEKNYLHRLQMIHIKEKERDISFSWVEEKVEVSS